jgi:type II secretory pathway pseudopilin PulG
MNAVSAAQSTAKSPEWVRPSDRKNKSGLLRGVHRKQRETAKPVTDEMRRSESNNHYLKRRPFRSPRPALLDVRGFAYIALLVAIIIIGISLGAAGKYWSNVILRDKEAELLYRGDQYRRAIERYASAVPGSQVYPQSIEDLLKDNRTAAGKRHLRQKYKDPISGEDFVEIRNPLNNRIIGVHSPSDKEPLKKAGFPDTYSAAQAEPQPGFPSDMNNFSDKKKYSEWLFVATVKSVQTSTVTIRRRLRSVSTPPSTSN